MKRDPAMIAIFTICIHSVLFIYIFLPFNEFTVPELDGIVKYLQIIIIMSNHQRSAAATDTAAAR